LRGYRWRWKPSSLADRWQFSRRHGNSLHRFWIKENANSAGLINP